MENDQFLVISDALAIAVETLDTMMWEELKRPATLEVATNGVSVLLHPHDCIPE